MNADITYMSGESPHDFSRRACVLARKMNRPIKAKYNCATVTVYPDSVVFDISEKIGYLSEIARLNP